MLAHNWLEHHLRVFGWHFHFVHYILGSFVFFVASFLVHVAGVVAIDTDPVHFAAATNLVFTNNRDVVFGLATNNTSAATDAGV